MMKNKGKGYGKNFHVAKQTSVENPNAHNSAPKVTTKSKTNKKGTAFLRTKA